MKRSKKAIIYATAFSTALFSVFVYLSVSKKATLDNYLDHTAQIDAFLYSILAAKKTKPWEEISVSTLKNGEFIKPLIAENFEHSNLDSSGENWVILTIQNGEMYNADYCQWLMAHQDTALNSAVVLQLCGGGSVQLLFSNRAKEPSQFKRNETASEE